MANNLKRKTMAAVKHLLVLNIALIGLFGMNATFAKPSCPSQDFGRFLKIFANNVQVQQAFTAIPLAYSNPYESDFVDPPVMRYLQKSEIEFPVFFSDSLRKEEGIVFKVKSNTRISKSVFTQHREGTGADHIQFDFKKQHGCWFLTRKLDSST
jgi:hypothetical protein